MFDLTSKDTQFAFEAVRQACLVVRQVQSELVIPAKQAASSLTKEDRSPVTVADFAAQAVVGCLMEKMFPSDYLVAEEDSSALRKPSERKTLELVSQFAGRFTGKESPKATCAWIDFNRVDSAGRFWTLDPIDGTKGFLRGDQYAIALALVVEGRVELGVLGCPNLARASQPDLAGEGSLIVAQRGGGAWTTPLVRQGFFAPLQVSERSNPSEARVLRSFESGHTNVDQIDTFSEVLGIQAEALRMDSQAKYGILAAGEGDILLRLLSPSRTDYREKIWDQAAGSLILEEAGGRITDLDGKPLDFTTGRELKHNRGLLATNGWLHAAALTALRQIGA